MVIVSLGDAPPPRVADAPAVTPAPAPAAPVKKAKSRPASQGARKKKVVEQAKPVGTAEKVNQVVVGTPVKLLPGTAEMKGTKRSTHDTCYRI